MEPRSGFRLTSQLVLGAAIAVVGVLFTLDNLHVLHAREYLRFWPVALIAIGLVHVSQAKTAAGTIGGRSGSSPAGCCSAIGWVSSIRTSGTSGR